MKEKASFVSSFLFVIFLAAVSGLFKMLFPQPLALLSKEDPSTHHHLKMKRDSRINAAAVEITSAVFSYWLNQ